MFVDGGRGLITYGGQKGLTLRAVETGAEVRTIDAPGLAGTDPTGDPQVAMRFAAIEASPDGRYLAALGYQSPRVRLFEVATGRPIGPVLEHKNTVFSATFSPDGRMLLTGSTDNTARQWAVPSGEPLIEAARPPPHRQARGIRARWSVRWPLRTATWSASGHFRRRGCRCPASPWTARTRSPPSAPTARY